jgi:integrase
MARAKPNRRLLNEGFIQTLAPRSTQFLVWDTLQHGLCLRCRPSGAKSYRVAYQHQGRTRWFNIGSHGAIGLKAARAIARQVREQAAAGRDPQAEKVDARLGETLRHIHSEYLEKQAKKKNKSWRQAAALMEKHVLRKLGRKKIKEITRKNMWEIFDSLHDRPVLANAVMNAASATYTWAVKREYLDANPCHGIERHETKPVIRFLSNEEIRTVWPLFDSLGLHKSTVLKLVLLTAQRLGEVRCMRWEHVDMAHGLWSMPGKASPIWPGTKNGRDHEVPLTKPVLDLLEELDPQPSGYVFPSTTRYNRPIADVLAVSIWQAAGMPRFRPHDLRATAATGMDSLGIVRQHISLVLNHVEAGVTASYIRHDARQHKRAALEAWSKELEAILAGEGKTDHKAKVVSIARA